jgi:Putative transposase
LLREWWKVGHQQGVMHRDGWLFPGQHAMPGGGISLDGQRWVSSRPAFLLPVRVLSKLFRPLFLTRLLELHTAGRLAFFGDHAGLREEHAFTHLIARLRKKNWVVYAKPPFGGPEAVLAYLSRYTHRVAISNWRLISLDENAVTPFATRIIAATVPNAIAQ